MRWGLVIALVAAGLITAYAAAWNRRWKWTLISLGAAASAGPITFALITHPVDRAPIDPHPDAAVQIVAIGDSYMSGEGAAAFFPGTDLPGKNMCHRASTAYPYLIAKELDATLVFAACSGAISSDITGVYKDPKRHAQYENSPTGVLGSQPQLDVLRSDPRVPDIVLLDIGGNDAGFADIGQGCALPTSPDCRSSAQYWINQLDKTVYPAVQQTFKAVADAVSTMSPRPRLFVLTYPDPLGPNDCSRVRFSPPELGFLRGAFIPRLNQLITFAASHENIPVIDLQDSLVGYRLCDEVALKDAAVNFVALARSKGSGFALSADTLSGLIQGTFHPNARGHRMIADVVEQALQDRTIPVHENPGPAPPGLPPNGPDVPPPFVPKPFDVPLGPYPFPSGTNCTATQYETITPRGVDNAATRVEISDLAPSSRVCYRSFEGPWRDVSADSAGNAVVPLELHGAGLGSINEILVQHPDRSWDKINVEVAIEGGGSLDRSTNFVFIAIMLLAIAMFVVLPLVLLVRHLHSPAAAPA